MVRFNRVRCNTCGFHPDSNASTCCGSATTHDVVEVIGVWEYEGKLWSLCDNAWIEGFYTKGEPVWDETAEQFYTEVVPNWNEL